MTEGVVDTAVSAGERLAYAVFDDSMSWDEKWAYAFDPGQMVADFVTGVVIGEILDGIMAAIQNKLRSIFVNYDAAMREALESGSTTVIYGADDISNYQYNMIENPGPLVEAADNPAKNFYGGRYNVNVLEEDTIFYRVGQSGKPLGQWFTSEAPESVAKVRIDTAVKPQWINQTTGELTGTSIVDTAYAIKIPKGTITYTGPIGPQGGVYCGGYDKLQTFIETPWKINGIEVIDSFPLK